MDDLGCELELALELAEAADAITMRWFGSRDLTVEAKADRTPVTEADRGVEAAWRQTLAGRRATHAILGEEMGDSAAARDEAGGEGAAGAWRWVLDPIDGTKNFVRGVPVWASLCALEVNAIPVVGVVSAPALGRRWWAVRGGGAWESGRRIGVSTVDRIEDAYFSYDSLERFEDEHEAARWIRFARSCGRSRGLGDFWSHVLVAEGAVDVAAEPVVEHWDLSALQVIVEEAGGRFTDLEGIARPNGGSALSTNGLLHSEALAALAQPRGAGSGGASAGE